jgi:hypothetical protein
MIWLFPVLALWLQKNDTAISGSGSRSNKMIWLFLILALWLQQNDIALSDSGPLDPTK